MTRAAVLTGLGAVVPPRVVTNEMLAQRLDTSDEWIVSRTGIRERRVIEPGEATSDLATRAGALALKSAQATGVDGVDLLVLATTTPDHPCPATAPDVASRLGLGTVPAFDLAAVCSGFVYALGIARAAITGGMVERALVIGAEAFSTIIDPDDRTTVPIFGDGAGAAVLRAGSTDENGAIRAVDLGSDGSLRELITVPAGGSRQRSSGHQPDPKQTYFSMCGQQVFVHAVNRMTGSARRVLDRTGWQTTAVDWLVSHQANVRILRAVCGQLGLPPERALVHLDRVGNTSAASIPLALAHGASEGTIRAGQRVLLTAFGGGATWGATTLTWPDITPF